MKILTVFYVSTIGSSKDKYRIIFSGEKKALTGIIRKMAERHLQMNAVQLFMILQESVMKLVEHSLIIARNGEEFILPMVCLAIPVHLQMNI